MEEKDGGGYGERKERGRDNVGCGRERKGMKVKKMGGKDKEVKWSEEDAEESDGVEGK